MPVIQERNAHIDLCKLELEIDAYLQIEEERETVILHPVIWIIAILIKLW